MRFALMLACFLSGAVLAAPAGVTHVKFICNVYVDETGTPSKAEVTGTEPKVVINEQTKQDVLSMSIYSRKFPVRFEDRKPAAGYRTIPVEIDFDTPVPLDHN
jgi:hypothetical protein